MFMTAVLCGLLALLSFLLVYLKNDKKYWQTRGVPTKPSHFILGHLNGVGKSCHMSERFDEFYNEFKDSEKFCGIYLLSRPVALIFNLDLVREICVKEFSKFHDRGMYMHEEADPISAHLFSLAGTKWRNMRNKLSPTFTSGKLKLMFPTIVGIADNMLKVFEKQITIDKTIDIKRLCGRFSIDVAALTAFGLDSRTLENDDAEILKISNILFRPSIITNFKFFFMNSYSNIAYKLRMKQFPERVTNYFMTVLRETVENRENNNIKRNDFIDILIKIKNSGTVEAENSNEAANFVGKITFNELAAQAFVFFFAGFETSGTAMSFCLLELGRNQKIQDRVRSEIKSVLKKHDNRLTYEGVVEMTYLGQCFNEAMRLYPPAQFLLREVTEDYKVLGTEHVLEKGTQLFVPMVSIHRDKIYYPDPMKYDPDRFTPENIKSRHPYAYLPFGEGPRICIGNRFALLQSKIGLASILSNFRVSMNEKTIYPIELETDNQNLAARGGIWLDFEKL